MKTVAHPTVSWYDTATEPGLRLERSSTAIASGFGGRLGLTPTRRRAALLVVGQAQRGEPAAAPRAARACGRWRSARRRPDARGARRERPPRRSSRAGGDRVELGEDRGAPSSSRYFDAPPRAGALDLHAGAVLAGEESAGERVVREAGEPLAGAEGGEAALVLGPVDEVVVRLERHESGEARALRDGQRLGEPRLGVVGGRDVADLSFAHESVERAQRLLERRRGVVGVRVVEVDAVCPEPAERALGRRADRLRREAASGPGASRPSWRRPSGRGSAARPSSGRGSSPTRLRSGPAPTPSRSPPCR